MVKCKSRRRHAVVWARVCLYTVQVRGGDVFLVSPAGHVTRAGRDNVARLARTSERRSVRPAACAFRRRCRRRRHAFINAKLVGL